jgi:dephospho-CoA kinase
MIIGIVGTLGAGKGTVVAYLVQRGFTHYSVSGRLKKILDERGVSAVRANLSALADELLTSYKGGILEVMYTQAVADGVEDCVIESIHRVSEAEYLRSEGAVIIGVDASPRIRYERAIKRQEGEKDAVTYEQFLADMEREEEGKGSGMPHIRAVLAEADFLITNDGTLDQLHTQIDAILEQLSL